MAEKSLSARWMELAGEARFAASELGDTELGRAMLKVAARYERIATRAEFFEAWESRDEILKRYVAPWGIW